MENKNPEQNPNYTDGQSAPGLFFTEGEFPVVADPYGPPASTGGFSPEAGNPSLESANVPPKAPAGRNK